MLGCMWDFGFLYLVAGIGALSTLIVYRAHGSASYSMVYAWIGTCVGVGHCDQLHGHADGGWL